MEKGLLSAEGSAKLAENDLIAVKGVVKAKLDAAKGDFDKATKECEALEKKELSLQDEEQFLTGNITRLNRENLVLQRYASRFTLHASRVTGMISRVCVCVCVHNHHLIWLDSDRRHSERNW